MPVDIIENREAWEAAYNNEWLKHFNETGETKWDIYKLPDNKTQPTGTGIDPATAKLLLVTSAGSYLKDSQEPFDAANKLGDYTIRRYPVETPFEALAYAHDHYNHTAVDEDPQVLVPLQHLKDMVDEGIIGELAPEVVSFMGYQPAAARVIDETIPDIVAVAKELQVTAVLLVPS
ncbi:MAG: glycine/sarcosine/betaine reductase selenoprotein B family protein [Chloroflexota bacterium]